MRPGRRVVTKRVNRPCWPATLGACSEVRPPLQPQRIAHQARQTTDDLAPDNYLSLNELSNFERTQLKDAFTVVQSMQSVLGQRYRF